MGERRRWVVWAYLTRLVFGGGGASAPQGNGPDSDGGERPEGLREAGDNPVRRDLGLQSCSPAEELAKASPLAYGPDEWLRWKLRYLLWGERPQPVPSYRGPVEKPAENKTGICCSGGGIRSAAFNLGALQALQESPRRELQEAHYLAAVSGGSYICAAYSMVGRTWPTGAQRPPDIEEEPYNGHDDSDPELLKRTPAFARSSAEEQYLRNRSSYMAPDTMAKLYLGIRVLLGLMFNLVFIALPVAVVTAFFGLLIYAPTLDGLVGNCGTSCSFDPPAVWVMVPAGLAIVGVALALLRLLRRPGSDRQRKFSEVWSTRLLMGAGFVALTALVLPALVDVAAEVEVPGGDDGEAASTTIATGGAGLAGLIAGLLAYLREAFSKPVKTAGQVSAARERFRKMSSRVRRILMYLAGAVAGPLLLLAVAVLTLSAVLDSYRSDSDMPLLLTIAGAVAFVGLYLITDLTSLSLHPFYKRRLCTAFALKRVKPNDVAGWPADADIPQETRDGVAVEREFDRHVPLSETALAGWPSLIVCAAANISDPGATPPGRRVTSFTFGADTVGGPLVGAMPTETYEQTFGDKRTRDFSLPAAVAMSGAAISPSMGKSTPRAFTFLLALANVRLGVWIPNPLWVGSERGQFGFKKPRPSYLIRELLGRNRVHGRYLYVTDGGHYENLGLVELLRRGCTRVFCFDASGGQKFAELGDAVALARSELGVKIEIDPTPLSPKGKPPTAKRATTTGIINYRDGTKGHLVYARNVMAPGGPWDVRAHQLENPNFPHDSTVDQLYTDQKFESYRALGAEAGKQAVARMNDVAPIGEPLKPLPDRGPDLPPQRVKELLETASVQLVDMRDRFARDVVRIAGAKHIEQPSVNGDDPRLRKLFPVVFHCDGGRRSRQAAEEFREAEWNAFYVEGGIRRWIDDGLPVDREPESAAAPVGGS